MEKVVGLGVSGGVDSSVSGYLLKKMGYKVIGYTLILNDVAYNSNLISEARKVCDFLGIEHRVLDFRNEFKNIVMNDFIENYKKGYTPNPCCVCNRYFKFGIFYNAIKDDGCDFIATGHYAKIIDGKLYRAHNLDKDQSYFLHGINKDVLSHIIFPLADYDSKDDVREVAKEIGLFVSNKKDSQEVCFIPNDDYKSYLRNNNVKENPGDICLKDGTVLGKHNGLFNYTIGQRKGLNISYSEPLYVISLDTDNNRVIVGSNDDLYQNTIVCSRVNYLTDKLDGTLYAKVRSRGHLIPCTVDCDGDMVTVHLLEKERAITNGQYCVFYNDNDQCLGGGVIEDFY